MARFIAVCDLVGAHEIAQRLGVARPQVVHEWRRRHPDFPMPIANLVRAMIWDWNEVEKWADSTGRRRPAPDDQALRACDTPLVGFDLLTTT